MPLTLYHGSESIIPHPNFNFGNIHNDYGQGFYCTEDKDLACEWACATNRNGFANSYSIETGNLKILDLNDGSYTILNWIALLLANRRFDAPSRLASRAKDFLLDRHLPDTESFDIIKGYRADDSHFMFARDFLNGGLSLERLEVAMRLGNLGEQIMVKSQQAFDALSFIDACPVDAKDWHPLYQKRDSAARRDYTTIRNGGTPEYDTYIIDIMRNASL